jgi:DNA gyrase subunit A
VEPDEPPAWLRREKALSRLAILDALVIAMDRRDELMQIVGSAENADAALAGVVTAFGLDDLRAQVVLDLQVRRFAVSERARIIEERDSLRRDTET